MKVETKIISSLEKVFLDNTPNNFEELTYLSLLKGERASFQLVFKINDYMPDYRMLLTPEVKGELAPYVLIREVKNVPVDLPVQRRAEGDSHYLRKTPGLYPDILAPVEAKNRITATKEYSHALWIDIDIPADIDFHGESELVFTLKSPKGEITSENKINIEVINAVLPKQTMYLTQWFYTDCIANYYEIDVWSEKHWEYIENFATVAHKNGLNLILTPVFTPELDTEVGGERLTTQLVGVTETKGEYSFDFTLVDRWIEMCNRVGIEYFEISHLFSQWGAKATPKIMATVDGEYKQIFGWHTPATGDEYKKFIRAFLTEFIAHMKKRGDDKRCLYHISDEPNLANLENYKAAKGIVEDLLEDYTIMDALSSFEFWQQGIVKTPIPHTSSIEPFIENNVPDLWAYYCGASDKISGRAIAMPSWRNRCLGMQLYKYNIVGFLHWGFNFYNACSSTKAVNPFIDSSGDGWVTCGDTYMVYPGSHGKCLESLRLVVFGQAITDVSAMNLCEKYYSHEEIVSEMEKIFGDTITFSKCTVSSKQTLAIRQKINDMIKAKI